MGKSVDKTVQRTHATSRRRRSAATVLLAIGIAGCDADRSANPLSPNIAGPIAGVAITRPNLVGPVNGALLSVTDQPVILLFQNASSNSVRQFFYVVSVSRDDGFQDIVISSDRIEPTDGPTTSHELQETLAGERTYYWRIQALDGANTGEYSATAMFEIFTPVVIAAPAVGAPADGATTASNFVTLSVVNPEIAGPATSIMYRFELAADPSFTTLSAVLTVGPGTASSTSVSSGGLPHNATFYWRARVSADARNGMIFGPWTPTTSFTTPPPPVVINAPTPSSPINGATVTTLRPTLAVANGEVTGDAGTVMYQFEVDNSPSFTSPESTFSETRSGSGTTRGLVTADLARGQQHYWRARGTNGTLTSSWSGTAMFLTAASAPSPGGNRAPDPPPGQRLPLPDMAAVVAEVGALYSEALENSCQLPEFGGTPGNWEFMDRLVDRLRQTDTRWGYNGKRGNSSDPSEDVLDYHWGRGPEAGSTDVYIVKVIYLYCRPDPGTAFIDLTQDTQSAGTIGRWTGRGRF